MAASPTKINFVGINSASYSVSPGDVMVWGDESIGWVPQAAGGLTIDSGQVVFGTGAGATSSQNFVIDNSYRSLVFGYCNLISATVSRNIVVIGGRDNDIRNAPSNYADGSSILGGYKNSIDKSKYSSIIGGQNGSICKSNRSVIGGQFLSLSNTNDTVMVPNFLISGSVSVLEAGVTFSGITMTQSVKLDGGGSATMTIKDGIIVSFV